MNYKKRKEEIRLCALATVPHFIIFGPYVPFIIQKNLIYLFM